MTNFMIKPNFKITLNIYIYINSVMLHIITLYIYIVFVFVFFNKMVMCHINRDKFHLNFISFYIYLLKKTLLII